MLKDYLVVAQEALSAQKEIYQVKQQRLELAQQEYRQLHAVWEHKLGSQVSCEYLPRPRPSGTSAGRGEWLRSVPPGSPQCFSPLPLFFRLRLLLLQTTVPSDAFPAPAWAWR